MHYMFVLRFIGSTEEFICTTCELNKMSKIHNGKVKLKEKPYKGRLTKLSCVFRIFSYLVVVEYRTD